MARRKKKKGSRGASRSTPQGARPAAPPPPTPAPSTTVERLIALRRAVADGRATDALATVDGWLAELGAAPPVDPPVEASEAPSATPDAPQTAPDDPGGPIAADGCISAGADAPAADDGVDAPAAAVLQPLDAPGPRFSVLMAAYDRAELIGEAIDSVLAQDFADWELVVVDDGSTDETPAIVERYAAAEPRVRFVRKPRNEGRSATRNRAMAEARGEFVLWMADDDLLVPGVLTRYDAVLRDEPHVDVIYGKLQLFEGARDLHVYTPNDWTGRDAELLGAELHGSCVPDGGTATRRRLYAHVGAPIYDPEFVRAQDYELWTRLLPHARVRFVDEVVYRYRKHDGGTSWGDFVDLSYDSKIIRRHLSRHPLEALFTRLDWTAAAGARRAAMMQLGRLMLAYQDPHNAERFFAAVADGDVDPDAVEQRIIGRLMAGDLQGAEAALGRFAAAWPGRHALMEALKDRIERTRTLRAAGRAAIAEGRPSEAEHRAVDVQNTDGLGFDVALLRARARLAGGDEVEGLFYACQAARLAIDDAEAPALAAELAALTGKSGPKFDIEAMRGRLREVFADLEADAPPPAGPATVSAIVIDDGRGSARLVRALRSVLAQSRPVHEVLIVGAESPVDDPRIRRVEGDRAAALAAASGDLVGWLPADHAWYPRHVARLAAALEADDAVSLAWGEWHTEDDCADGRDAILVRETGFAPPPRVTAGRLLADDLVPLAAVMHRRAVDGAAFALPAVGDWAFVLDRAQGGPMVRVGPPTLTGPPRPTATPPVEALERVFGRHPTALLFDATARRRQAERLAPFGVDWPGRGRTGVVILGDADPAPIVATLASVEAHTRCPRSIVVVADAPGEAARATLAPLVERHTAVYSPRPVGPARRLNLGLARAGGDRVVIVRAGVEVSAGWLGRLRYAARGADDDGIGWVVPAGGDVERPDDQCLLVTRAALDTVGGADVVLEPAAEAFADWLRRMRRAGFGGRVAEAVAVAASGATQRFGGPPLSATPADGVIAHCPYGAEEGFRPDIPPVTVVDGAPARRVLIVPPWSDAAALGRLVALLADLPMTVAVWLRAAPGEGGRAVKALAAAGPEPPGPVFVVDAHLAPDREGGLFVAADAVYVDPGWPDAAQTIRRAFDCARPPLRTPDALKSWAEGGAA